MSEEYRDGFYDYGSWGEIEEPKKEEEDGM